MESTFKSPIGNIEHRALNLELLNDCDLRITSYDLRATIAHLRITGYERRLTAPASDVLDAGLQRAMEEE